jgi:AcrR family transcriptional regulator
VTKPGTRARYHHGDLRNALLEAAQKLIAERGPESFSLREAARAVGVSPAAVYRHFSDRMALLAAIASEGTAQLGAAMEKAVARETARLPLTATPAAHAASAFAAIATAYLEFALRHPAHFRVTFGPAVRDKSFVPRGGPSGRRPYLLLVDALDNLVTTGAIPAERRQGAEMAAWALAHGFATLIADGVLRIGSRARREAFQVMLRVLMLGLGCDLALVPEPGPVPDVYRPLHRGRAGRVS